MTPAHKEAFFYAADQFSCWIGVREPNSLADRWIGRAGYTPKAANCKAKTADHPAHRFGPGHRFNRGPSSMPQAGH